MEGPGCSGTDVRIPWARALEEHSSHAAFLPGSPPEMLQSAAEGRKGGGGGGGGHPGNAGDGDADASHRSTLGHHHWGIKSEY